MDPARAYPFYSLLPNHLPEKGCATAMQGITIIGSVMGVFVLMNGIYCVMYPPFGDEPQGLAIIAIGIFIIMSSLHMAKTCGSGE